MAKKKSQSGSQTHFAHITGSVLTWAIERSTETREALAEKLGVKTDDIRRWEEEKTPPQFKKAKRLAKILRVPFGALYLSTHPDGKVKLPDMRKLPAGYKQSPNFVALVYEVQRRQDWYRELLQSQSRKPIQFIGRFTSRSSHLEVAADMRRVLGITSSTRQDFRSPSDYITHLARQAESAGVLVMRSGVVGNDATRAVSPNEFQGFALFDELAPVVFVNSKDHYYAQVFTLIHELVHLWIGQTAISKPSDDSTNQIEKFCNLVAAELLAPESEFRPSWRVNKEPLLDRVEFLHRRYLVSRLVVVNRAFELGLISKSEQIELKQSLASNYKPKAKTKKVNPYTLVASRAGHRFTHSIVNELQSGGLFLREAQSLLGVSRKVMSKLAHSPIGA